MQFLIVFPFPSPASVPCCLINTRGLCFPSQAQGLPACSADVLGTLPRSPPGASGWLDVPLVWLMCVNQDGDCVSLSRLSVCPLDFTAAPFCLLSLAVKIFFSFSALIDLFILQLCLGLDWGVFVPLATSDLCSPL